MVLEHWDVTGKMVQGPCWGQILPLVMIPLVTKGSCAATGFWLSQLMVRNEGLRLFQTFPAPAHPAVPMGESVLSLPLTFLSTHMDFSSWTRAHGKDFRGVGASFSTSEIRLAQGEIPSMGLSCGHKRPRITPAWWW